MKFLHIFFVCASFLFTTACNNQEKEQQQMEREALLEKYQESISLSLELYQLVDKYKDELIFSKNRKKIYTNISQMYYDMNIMHNDMIQNHEAKLHLLKGIETRLIDLEQLISSVHWPDHLRSELDKVIEQFKSLKSFIEVKQEETNEESESINTDVKDADAKSKDTDEKDTDEKDADAKSKDTDEKDADADAKDTDEKDSDADAKDIDTK